jgi:glucose-1-phosphate cytidylyltransferase
MKTIILCGGLGTRLSEETIVKPKPMVEIGEMPMLWHIMKLFDRFGYKNFFLTLGYKGEVIKDFFINYQSRLSDIRVNLADGALDILNRHNEDWVINLIDTGSTSMTGGRVLRIKKFLDKNDDIFFVTYGDGLANINIEELLAFHKKHKKIATITSVRPAARFGNLELDGLNVKSFKEKPQSTEGWINGGFFVFNKKIFDYIDNDLTILEKEPLERLAAESQLMAFRHTGYWQCMDTVRDRDNLRNLFESGEKPWVYNL